MKSRILIIEDNEDVRENIEELLQLSNYEVTTASNGKLGVQSAFNKRPDLIICDIMMPEIDGYGVLKILNNNPALADIPFIFLSAKTEKFDVRRGMMLGATDFIIKPFDDQELLEVIDIRLKKATVNTLESSSILQLSEINVERAKLKLNSIIGDKEKREIKKREILFEEGQKPRYIYFVCEGKVRTYLSNENGKEYTNYVYAKGDFFVIQDAINGRTYTMNGITIEDSTVALIPISEFLDLLKKDTEFLGSILKLMAAQMNMQDKAILHQAYSSVRRKVANALLYLFEKNNGSNHFQIQREDLASIAGTAKETLIRTLTDFKNEGIISIEDSEIEIKNIGGLVNMPQ
jgi:DNA-binding response OmpR family regulator